MEIRKKAYRKTSGVRAKKNKTSRDGKINHEHQSPLTKGKKVKTGKSQEERKGKNAEEACLHVLRVRSRTFKGNAQQRGTLIETFGPFLLNQQGGWTGGISVQ